MQYEGSVYRPPSEAHSLIVQVTIGCARNTCTFCSMYKDKQFRIRELEPLFSELKSISKQYGRQIRRIFLADGDALILPTKTLLALLATLYQLFPQLERVSSYGAPADILQKTSEELDSLRAAGLTLVYMGLESGDDEVLLRVKKGVTCDEMVQAGQKLRNSGIALSMTIISGLGSKQRMQEHATLSALAMNRINPEYASLLTLMVEPGTPLFEEVQTGKFELLSPTEVMQELVLFLEHSDSNQTVFRSNHASNYLALAGTLNQDKDRLLQEVRDAAATLQFRPEHFRGL